VNARQRFLETMRFGSPDRVPLFEEGLRDGVRENWHGQGLPAGADLSAWFGYDARERVPVALEPRGPAGGDPSGRPGLADLRRRLDADDPSRLPDDWPQRVRAWRTREHVLELPIHSGLFLTLGVGDWRTFEQAGCLLADEPGLVGDILAAQGEFAAAMARRVLREVEPDFASFSEPIGSTFGPLVSPQMYEQLVLPGYRPILDALRAGGVETIVLITYANARSLLPAALAAGFNALWAVEAGCDAMDYLSLRRQFGPDLRLIGGIDLDALLAGEDAVAREIAHKVPPLLAQGGYVPLADGRIRENVPFGAYRRYRTLLEQAALAAGSGR